MNFFQKNELLKNLNNPELDKVNENVLLYLTRSINFFWNMFW